MWFGVAADFDESSWNGTSTMEDRQWFVLYVVVCLEVGIFLTLVPWSAIWERNYFLEVYPTLRPILLAPSVRGAVAGLGAANIYMGLMDLVGRRRAGAPARDMPGDGRDPDPAKPGSRSEAREALAATEDGG